MAGMYGLICIAMAFRAGSMGGILHCWLFFRLGLCTTPANQRGVLFGVLIGLIFSFLIGFGRPKPPVTALNFKVDGCVAASNKTLVAEALTQANITFFNRTTTQHPTAEEPTIKYFWVCRLWFSVIGFLITAVAGYGLSVLLQVLKWAQ